MEFKIALRNLLKRPFLNLIKVTGLSLGLTGTIIILLFILNHQLIAMLSWNFIKWIVVSFVLAIPLSFYAMNKWLEVFVYRTPLSWWIFVLAGLASIVIAFVSVFLQSFRATTTNPIEVLRHD